MKARGQAWQRPWSHAVTVARGVTEWLGARLVDDPVWTAAALAFVGVAMLLGLRDGYGGANVSEGIFVEATGALMDLVVFGIFLALVGRFRQRKRNIASQQELIDDYKKWDSEEGRLRIAGAVRRLNRQRQFAIDFVGLEVSDFSFPAHDVQCIAGSKFYLGTWGTMGSCGRTALDRVDFSRVDCRNVVFSAFNPFGGLNLQPPAQFRDCQFISANLRGATFKGALLSWSDPPPKELGEWIDTADGDTCFAQTHHSPFDGADIAGASFEDVKFRNVDFRDTLNLRQCRFAGATGLEDAMFDDDEDKEWALAAARTPKELSTEP